MPSGTSQLPGPISKAVAEIVSDAINSRDGLSQAVVAREANMSTSQFSRVLNGHKVFTLEELDRVCFALGLEIADVIDRADQASRKRRRQLAPVTPIGGTVSRTEYVSGSSETDQQVAVAAKKRSAVKDTGSDEGF